MPTDTSMTSLQRHITPLSLAMRQQRKQKGGSHPPPFSCVVSQVSVPGKIYIRSCENDVKTSIPSYPVEHQSA